MKKSIGLILLLSLLVNVVLLTKYNVVQKVVSRIIKLNKINVLTISDLKKGNQMSVYFLNKLNVEKKKSLKDVNSNTSTPLSDNLFISPGFYSIKNNIYDFNKEGLYRIMSPGNGVFIHKIVFTEDLDALLSSLSWLTNHGNVDDKLTNKLLIKKLHNDKIYVTCGIISQLAVKILKEKGFKARFVMGMAKPSNWNSYDNDHSLIEVFNERYEKWVLYDLDNNFYFVNEKGLPLSLIEAISNISNGNYKLIPLSNDIKVYDMKKFNLFSEVIVNNIDTWYKRCMLIPLIKRSNKIYFYNKEFKKDLLSYSSQFYFKDKDDFMDLFYR
ncbi:hypothetical protein DID74_00405 [Candidatus Marinamargulisbacteria bacterium SCGC AG-333-B06]|nr:hypothetical protein DID74_00405 [Candidatus Marinamargulisbacteria bacterium SCGC AG-333-B06]